MKKPSKPRSFNVFVVVGYHGRPLIHLSRYIAFKRRDIDYIGALPIVRATLTLQSGKPRKKNSGGPARSKGTK